MRLLATTLAAAVITVASPLPGQEASPVSASVPAGVDAYVRGVMEKRHVPGASVAVVRDGKVVLSKGYGLANVELGVPATPDTVYQLASVTKTFTATAVMTLVKEGKLSLDDRITVRLPGLPKAWEGVTVRHLLSHTSGIKSYTSVKDFGKTARKDYAPREIIALVAGEPLEFPPGEKWAYCNTGYFLLGMLVEKVTGKPYGEFLADRVFRPLGMTHTRANDLRAVIPGRAQGYEWDGKGLRNGEYVSPTQPFAAGMLVSSVSDLVKWDAALTGNALLDKSSQKLMWTPTRLGGGGEAGYGLGWATGRVNGHRLVSHGGGIPGFSTEFAHYPDDRLTVIVLTNAEGGHAGAIARGLAGRVVPALAETVEEPIADPDRPTSDRLRGVLEGAVRGEVDGTMFTEAANRTLVPRIREDSGRLAALGALRSFRLLERKEAAGGLRLRYRAAFEKATLRASFALDGAGKIQGVAIQPED